MVVLVLMGDAEKKQKQFRAIGFSLDKHSYEKNTKERKKSVSFNFTFLFVSEVNILSKDTEKHFFLTALK